MSVCHSSFLMAALSLALIQSGASAETFERKGSEFLLDGKPYQILSGEMHYPRVPRAYWEDRLKKAKAMGLNTICTYLFWNLHEPKPGVWDFEDNNDFVAFIKACQKEGLHVIVRPGPYVCTEWDCGGIPGWTLADPQTKIRTNDPKFMQPAMAYLEKVSAMLKPLQVENGGPILMVQVENEYGSFGNDKAYLQAHMDAIRKGGYTGTLFTSDGPGEDMLNGGTLPDLTSTINFGGGAEKAFETLAKFRPDQPRMNGEFWVGWFDHWGAPHQETAAAPKAADYDWMLSHGVSVNIYMFEGGTNFGFTAGANWNGGRQEVDTTSYDYSAVLDEAGHPTAKFGAFRDVIKARVPGATFGELPPPTPTIAIPEIRLQTRVPLLASLSNPVRKDTPQTMESLGQSFGHILYRNAVKGPLKGELSAIVGDRAIVMIDGKRQGLLERRPAESKLAIDIPAGDHILDLLVENLGRVNFGHQMLNERKGILSPVKIDGHELTGWDHYVLPLDDVGRRQIEGTFSPNSVSPTLYRGVFALTEVGDTWLDMRGFGKGMVWINGHNLGRYWRQGPQQALYVPGCWLKAGDNEIRLLELDLPQIPATLASLTAPVWEVKVEPSRLARKPGQTFSPEGLTAALKSEFADGTTLQSIALPADSKGRYFALECLDAHDGQPFAAVAELTFQDEKGADLPREAIKVIYADSEEVLAEDGSANNAIDNQPTTFWHTEWKQQKPAPPHYLILDLGASHTLSGFRYLPRPGASGGHIKHFGVYLSDSLFKGL